MRYEKMICRRRFSLTIVFGALFMACAHATENARSSTMAARSPSMPGELDRFESDVEDTFDIVLTRSRRVTFTQVQRIRTSWTTLRPILERDGARDELLTRIDERVASASTVAASGSSSEIARAVNAVSEPLDEVFAMYSRGAQSPLLRLDYLGRELLLDGREARWNLAQHHIASIKATWDSLREDSRASSSQPAVVSFTTHLQNAQDATQQHSAKLERASQDLLEDVDGLERLLLTHSMTER